MDETKTAKKPAKVSELPDGIKALIELPSEHKTQPILLPAATPNSPKPIQQRTDRPKTQKELELDELIGKRQAIIDALKSKNPLVQSARSKIAEIIPTIRGKGTPHAMHLMEEAEKIARWIAIIDHGNIVISGTADELKTKTGTNSLEEAFLKLTGKTIRKDEANTIDHMRMRRKMWARK